MATKLKLVGAVQSRSEMDTRLLTIKEIESWVQPRFQRPIRVNAKVMEFCEGLKKSGGIIDGILTLGRLPDDDKIYKVDGAHRIEAAKMSNLTEFIADIRTTHFDTMSDMAEEFVKLNSQLVRMRADDILRGLEETTPLLQLLRKQCEFIGYENIRRASSSAPTASMSAILRCWFGSAGETPQQRSPKGSSTSAGLTDLLTEREVQDLSAFLNCAYSAWSTDPENYQLWGNLNISMCMWLFRQLVLNSALVKNMGNKRHVTINMQQFKICLMALSAKGDYVEWLRGRNIAERDRAPCYGRIREIFTSRLMEDGMSKRPKLPAPDWSTR